MLKKLVLTEEQKECLANYAYLIIERGGFNLVIRKSSGIDTDYEICIDNPYDNTYISKQMVNYNLNKEGR